MININKLRGKIAERGLSQRKLSQILGISEATFHRKMKKGIFGSNEIEKMIEILNITNPCEIFFDKKVAQDASKDN